ncbi:MAG: MBL fold metallo-hydrolase [Ignavibacteria bacterium]|nr:MBL fold metallo-hydrolase [Ignavibacteria bacterium]
MKIKVFTVNPYRVNSYLYYDEINLKGFIIDPGYSSDEEKSEIFNFIISNNISVKYIINTHGHIDHIAGVNITRKYFNVKSYMHKDDFFLIETILEYSEIFGFDISEKPIIDDFITEDLELSEGDLKLSFIHTPGHSPGGICAIDHINKIVFCGDLIFRNSVGRTDLPGGNTKMLYNSIRNKLFRECSDEYILCPGHMETSTIYEEKNFNQFLVQ